MKSHNNLHPQVCSLGNVMAAARSAMQGKISGHAAARCHARWETHAVQLAEEIANGSWQPGKYTYFDIHEPKLRRVAAAPFRGRVVHHALVRVLEPIFEKKFIEDSYACRKGKGTHAGVRRCAEFSRRFPIGEIMAAGKCHHAVPGSGTSGMSRAVRIIDSSVE